MKESLPGVVKPGKPTARFAPRALDLIKYYCKEEPNLEWAGVVFWKETSNLNFSRLEDTVLDVEDILLMTIDQAGSFAFEMTPDVLAYQVENNYLEHRTGLIHSHHTMDAYFSSVDDEEIRENSPQHYAYLSVVVNNRGKIVCRFNYVVNEHRNVIYPGDQAAGLDVNQVVWMHDCEVVSREDNSLVTGADTERLERVREEQKERKERKENGTPSLFSPPSVVVRPHSSRDILLRALRERYLLSDEATLYDALFELEQTLEQGGLEPGSEAMHVRDAMGAYDKQFMTYCLEDLLHERVSEKEKLVLFIESLLQIINENE